MSSNKTFTPNEVVYLDEVLLNGPILATQLNEPGASAAIRSLEERGLLAKVVIRGVSDFVVATTKGQSEYGQWKSTNKAD
jgi:DNA-binding MarR family transcriptional regulator